MQVFERMLLLQLVRLERIRVRECGVNDLISELRRELKRYGY